MKKAKHGSAQIIANSSIFHDIVNGIGPNAAFEILQNDYNMIIGGCDTGECNEIIHEDYDESIDIVNAFEELGLNTLNEDQLEIYHENLKIVKKYERTAPK